MLKFLGSLFHSVRTLAREPVFSLVVVLVLGLGIAANTTIFTVIDRVLLSSLPFRDPARVVVLWESNPNQPQPAGSHIPAARDNFNSWQREARSFEAMEAYQRATYNLTGLHDPERLDVARSTAGFFFLLGVQARLGRTFLPGDEAPGGNHVVLLSHTFFTNHFQGADPLGRTLLLNGVPYTIIGVLPQQFHLSNIFQGLFEYKPDLWIPLPPISATDSPLASKGRGLVVYARLANKVSIAQAEAEMKALAERRAQDDPTLNAGYSVNVFSLGFEDTDPALKKALFLLWLAVALVLLLVCINLAGLMLVRSASQQRTIAIMAALGARRGDIVRTMMAPGVVLMIFGTLLGVISAYGGIQLVVALKPGDIHSVERIALDTHSLFFTALVFAIVVCLVALLPAWLTSRGDLNIAMKQGPGLRITARPRSANRSILVTTEVAIALVLAIGSTLLVRSFQRLLRVNPGFVVQNVFTAHLVLPQPRYSNPEDQVRFCDRLLQGLRSLPQVEAASLIDNMPLHAIHYIPFEVEGRPAPQPGNAPTADYASATPNFFHTMEVPLRSGRLFTDADVQDNTDKVVIVNETLARKMWPHEDPLGSHIRTLNGTAGPWARVVGVVGDFVQFNVDTPPRPEMFWPAKRLTDMSVVVRIRGNAMSVAPSIKQKVWEVDRDQPISDEQTLQQIVRQSSSQARFNMWFLAIFAALGIALALVGIYGLISYLVSSRTRDIGVRLALGAQKKDVFLSLLWQTLPFVAIGIVLGLGMSVIVSRLMNSLLFGITTLDPATYAVAPVTISILMFLAIVVPARKATQVHPASVLRQE